MTEKHYQNDYKKKMGIDQSRTASQKLLDRAIGRRQKPCTQIKINDECIKKVKKQQQQPKQLASQQVYNKILKVVKQRGNITITKMQKSLQILMKCLDETEFLQKFDNQKIQQIVTVLIDNQLFMQATFNQIVKYAEIQGKLLGKLDGLLGVREKQGGSKLAIRSKIGFYLLLIKNITDDSFVFNKNLQLLKQSVFGHFSLLKNKESGHSISQQINQLTLYLQNKILKKLLIMPNIHLNWCRSGVTNFLKQFIVEYKQQLTNPKQFLVAYNKFINEKNKKQGTKDSSYDIMGNTKPKSGGTYTMVEQSDAMSTWCKRQ